MLTSSALSGLMEVVKSYPTYAEAQKAVDVLAESGFPVERLAIVAGDLRFIEQVTGRRGYGLAMGEGAGTGALIGGVLGFVLGLFGMVTPLTSSIILAFWGAVIGAALGALTGLLAHALADGRRDFSSVSGLQAGRYDLVAAADIAAQARRRLPALARSA